MMRATTKPLLELTAADLMSCDLVLLPQEMSLREAAGLLLRSQIGGAPVVDVLGTCVGVLSATDFVRQAGETDKVPRCEAPSLPVTCGFQTKLTGSNGQQQTGCVLPAGVCAVQRRNLSQEGGETVLCSQPHAVLADWQTVEVEGVPPGEVGQYMTADPVTASPETPIRALAQQMIDAHIHRIIIVDKHGSPIGVVSSTDILAALAYERQDS
jgi:CBS domain-containing protein